MEFVYIIKIHDKSLHRNNRQQGTYTINQKCDSKIAIFEIEFYGWWFLGYNFFYW
jgi:hypothetical protein